MPKVRIIVEPGAGILLDGKTYPRSAIVEVSEALGSALIHEGRAVPVLEEEVAVPVVTHRDPMLGKKKR